jgi:hypothetical protein
VKDIYREILPPLEILINAARLFLFSLKKCEKLKTKSRKTSSMAMVKN